MSNGDQDQPPVRETVHQQNLRFWSTGKLSSAIPRRVAERSASPQSAPRPLLSTVGNFNSQPVTDVSYLDPPYHSVGKLTFRSTDFWANCSLVEPYGTAWVIGNRTIMTCAHNIYESNCNAYSTNIVFNRAFNGTRNPQDMYSVVAYRIIPEYPTVPSANNDVAVCIVDRDFPDDILRIPPIINPSSSGYQTCKAVGYPGNKPDGLNKMWSCDGDFMPQLSDPDDRIVMASDFGGGSSGGPWVVQTNDGLRALGLQVGPAPGAAGNYQGSAYFGSKVNALVDWANGLI